MKKILMMVIAAIMMSGCMMETPPAIGDDSIETLPPIEVPVCDSVEGYNSIEFARENIRLLLTEDENILEMCNGIPEYQELLPSNQSGEYPLSCCRDLIQSATTCEEVEQAIQICDMYDRPHFVRPPTPQEDCENNGGIWLCERILISYGFHEVCRCY